MEMVPEVSWVTQVMEGMSLSMGKAETEMYFYRKHKNKKDGIRVLGEIG